MTTVHAQTGIKLATKPAKTSLLGGHFIYKANGTGETPSSANVVEWVDNDPTLWRHNVHIGSSGIKLRYGETTLSKWDTNSLIFYKPKNVLMARVKEKTFPHNVSVDSETFLSKIDTIGDYQFIFHQGSQWTYNEEEVEIEDYGMAFTAVDGASTAEGQYITIEVYNTNVTEKGIEITSLGIDVFGGQTNQKVASFGEMVTIGSNENGETRAEIYNSGFRFICKSPYGRDETMVSFKADTSSNIANPVFTFGRRATATQNYSNANTYQIGDTCVYNQIGYVCITEISTPEEFDSSKWKKIEGRYSFGFGYDVIASGLDSFAAGDSVKALGSESHAEGSNTIANGNFSHAEGSYTKAYGDYSHAEGKFSTTENSYSHAEGYYTTASGDNSHAEGYYTTASGNSSHSEGYYTTASGNYSHAEGSNTIASGSYSHAEGYQTQASGNYSHAMGKNTIATGTYQTVMGQYNATNSSAPFIIGNGSSDSNRSNLFTITSAGDIKIRSNNIWIMNELDSNNYLKISSDALEFFMNVDNVSTSVASFGVSARVGQIANGKSRVEIKETGIDFYNRTSGIDIVLAHIGYGQGTQEGGSTSQEDYPYYTFGKRNSDSPSTRGNYSFAAGTNNYASGWCSHAEGATTEASGECSHTEGCGTEASGIYSHAEGEVTKAKDAFCHAEGYYTEASNYSSHAEGYHTKAIGFYSHAEGYYTEANGYYSHAEGYGDSSGSRKTTAHGTASHAEGYNTIANSSYTHAQNLGTIAGYPSQTAIGKYNKNQTDTAFEIGNGSGYAESNRSNAFAVDWDGVARLAGSLFTGCSSSSTLGYEFGRKTGNHVVIGGIHVCWGQVSITCTANTYTETTVTLPYTYSSAPYVFTGFAARNASARSTMGTNGGDLPLNKIYVGCVSTSARNQTVIWMTIGA